MGAWSMLAGILVRGPAQHTPRNQRLTSSQAARCSTLVRRPARPTAGDGSCSESRRQAALWRQFFRDPALWRDCRHRKKRACWPDFRHRETREVLWLNSLYKPEWVDAQLAALDRKVGRPEPHGLAGFARGVMAEVVSKLCQQGRLSEAVQALGALVQTECWIPVSLFCAVLKKCVVEKDLALGRLVHALTVKRGYQSDTFLGTRIVRMYASLGRLQDAMDVFAGIAEPDVFTWSAVITANVKYGQDMQAIELYHRMRRSSVKPDGHVFVPALQACARVSDLKTGHQLHADVLASDVEPDLFVSACLVTMYAKCGSLEDARRVFDELGVKDVVTWTALIAGYSQRGMGQEALGVYSAMQEEGIAVPNSVTFVCLLQACAMVGSSALEKGKQLHEQIRERGYEGYLIVANCLVSMYSKCGSIEDAQRVFDGLVQKDVVSWNSIIAGCSQKGMVQKAFLLYSTMQEEGMCEPDSVTFVCLLQACASVGTLALEKGKELHEQIRVGGHEADVLIAKSLITMYAKCGNVKDAQKVFDRVGRKDLVTWNAMIAGFAQQGMGQEALDLHSMMKEDGIIVPDSSTFMFLLQACASLGTPALEKGKQLHAEIRGREHQADGFIANTLVNMYAKCGSLEDAQRVFDALGQKDVVTWNAMIAGYSQQGMGLEALQLYSAMRDEGIAVPDGVTFVCLLQACANVGSSALDMGKELHAQIGKGAHQADGFVASSLVNMYGKCGSLKDAQAVFDGLGEKDVVTWTALIAGYSQQGMGQEALRLYNAMREEGIAVPDLVTFVSLLQACASVGTSALEMGKQFHLQIRERGYLADVFVASSLVNMYAKCGSMEDAQTLFDGLGSKEVVTWTTLIAGYAQQGMGQEALCLYSAMQEAGIAVPDSVTFVCLLQACASVGRPALEKGKEIHVQVRERELQADVFIVSSLVNMYAKCGSLEEAVRLFKELDKKEVVTWTALIAAYSQQGMGQEALRLHHDMQEEGIAVADSVTFVCLLKACASVGAPALEKGKQIHARIRELGYESDNFLANGLVSMYAKCGSLQDAQVVFDALGQKDVVSWNAMIAACSQEGMGREALHLYSVMQEEGIAEPNSVTFVCLLQACASVGSPGLEMGKQLHAQISRRGYQAEGFVQSSLVNMYAKCGSLQEAHRTFDGLGQKDIVTWNALIAGYSQQGMGQEALRLYNTMQEEGSAVPNVVTFMCLLHACANVAALHLGRQIHAQVEEKGFQTNEFVASSLINMYGKSGSMVDAQQVFDALPEKDVSAWSALISGYSSHGESEVVFDLVHKMSKDGIQPVGITFLSILAVCSHVGLVNKGTEYFEAMSKRYHITPTVEHYTCMVDLLGRAGRLDEALALVRRMPVLPNAAVWHTLLGACQKWSNMEVGCYAFDQAMKLDRKDSAAYALMSNIYTAAQMWEQAQNVQARRVRFRAWKHPGQSWWTDMGGQVHSFLVGAEEHSKSEASLKRPLSKMKGNEYVANVHLSPLDVSQVRKEFHWCGHAKMVATAYALNKTADAIILVVRSLQFSADGDTASKYVLAVEEPPLICRDAFERHPFPPQLSRLC